MDCARSAQQVQTRHVHEYCQKPSLSHYASRRAKPDPAQLRQAQQQSAAANVLTAFSTLCFSHASMLHAVCFLLQTVEATFRVLPTTCFKRSGPREPKPLGQGRKQSRTSGPAFPSPDFAPAPPTLSFHDKSTELKCFPPLQCQAPIPADSMFSAA